MTDDAPLPLSGWYPAPHAGGELRYWDGAKWHAGAAPAATPAPGSAPEPDPVAASDTPGPVHPADPPQAPGPRARKRRIWPSAVVGVLILGGIVACTASVVNDMGGDNRFALPYQDGGPSANPPGEASSAPPDDPPASAYDTFETRTLTGTGDDVRAVDVSQPAIVTFECATCTSDTVLKTDGADPLLVDTVGAHRGQYIVNTDGGPVITQMTVDADAAWTITIADLTTVPEVDGAASGSGDSVVVMKGEFSAAELSNDGDSDFVVEAFGDPTIFPLVADEIGAYRGTVEMHGPSIVQVTSDGSWSITPK